MWVLFKRVLFSVLSVLFGFAFIGFIVTYFSPPSDSFRVDIWPSLITGVLTTVFAWLAVNAPKKSQKRKLSEAARQIRMAEVSNITELPIVSIPLSIILRPNEICYFQRAANVIVIKNEVVGRSGGSGGISVRVAKGVTLHSGRTASKAIRKDVTYTYPGIFSITSERFIMTGEKGFEQPIKNLTAYTPYNGYDGIMLQFGKIVYTITLDEPYWIPKILELMQSGNVVQTNG